MGEDWQDEYYIWDCAAGTGNLLAGLTNKMNIWASTLDKADVDVMKERIQNGANLLETHIFQFDFLNDDFSQLPKNLQAIINDPEKRKKLLIYINPPYAEAASKETIVGTGENKTDVAVTAKTYSKYIGSIGIAGRELFAQFLARIYNKIPSCIIANFSKLKSTQAPNFQAFRNYFMAKLEKVFVVPANTFDNAEGHFPIGFFKGNNFQNTNFVFIINTNIQSEVGTNHWIPFSEEEVNARDNFESHFMADFINGKLQEEASADWFPTQKAKQVKALDFSQEAQAVFNSGKALWQYYHAQPSSNVNASLYDIREYFQGRDASGKMNNKSDNAAYNELIGSLRTALKTLAEKIKPKVYEYGFLVE